MTYKPQIDMMEIEELRDFTIGIQNRLQECLNDLSEVVAHPAFDDASYWEAYLIEQLEENIDKKNPHNNDIGDLILSIHKMALDHDEECECLECEREF